MDLTTRANGGARKKLARADLNRKDQALFLIIIRFISDNRSAHRQLIDCIDFKSVLFFSDHFKQADWQTRFCNNNPLSLFVLCRCSNLYGLLMPPLPALYLSQHLRLIEEASGNTWKRFEQKSELE